jgi:hypothetical protein
MTFIDKAGGQRLAPTGLGPKAPVQNQPKVGRMEGHDVQVLPKAQTITPPTLPKPPSTAPKPLVQRTAQQTAPTYTLVRDARYGGIGTKDQLIAKAGRPKDDVSFGFLGSKKMSTGYKAILTGMDRYQDTFANDRRQKAMGMAGPSNIRLEALHEQLDGVGSAAQKYLQAKGHGRKPEITEIQGRVAHEKQVIQGLKDEVAKGAKLPDNMELSDIVAFAREGISLKDMAALHAEGLSPKDARDAIQDRNARATLSDPTKLKAYTDAKFTPREALVLERSGLGLAGGQLYRKMDLAITPQTIVKGFKDDPLVEPMKKLGSGAFNSVFTARYDTSNGVFKGVFKPLAPPDKTGAHRVERGWVASKTGIDPYNPQIAMRNLATCDIAGKLGFDVVPHTEIGSRTPPPPPDNQPTQLGLVMAQAQGVPAGRASPQLFNDPDVRREVTKLQLLDHLVGQGDRHGNNYFIHKDSSGKVIVTGIDNDQCFGKDLHDPNGIAQGNEEHNKGFRGTLMPPVMDRDMAKAFEDMTPESLETTLAGKLSPEEIAAAKDRLAGIKLHIATLRSTNMIIGPDEWGSKKVGDALNGSNSYVGRDLGVDVYDMFN